MRAALVTLLALLLAAGLAACDGAGGGDPNGETIELPAPGAGDEPDVADGECENADLVPEEGNRRAVEQATLCLVNAERTQRDREPLSDDADLTRAARAKARHMVENDYFDHVGPDGRDVRDWVEDTDYLGGATGFRLGENLGWASEGEATPARLVEGWMDSPSHRENILRPRFEDSGIGVVLGSPRASGGGGATYVHMFGAR